MHRNNPNYIKEHIFRVCGTNHNYIENKNLSSRTNQYYLRNKNLVRETDHDFKRRNKKSSIREQINQDYMGTKEYSVEQIHYKEGTKKCHDYRGNINLGRETNQDYMETMI
jgi:hypothetical protein